MKAYRFFPEGNLDLVLTAGEVDFLMGPVTELLLRDFASKMLVEIRSLGTRKTVPEDFGGYINGLR